MHHNYEYSYLSPIGFIKIRTTNIALISLEFVDEASENLAIDDYPQIMKNVLSELTLYFMGQLKVFTVNILQESTQFRLKVYDELKKIPYGETVSYKVLASKIGNPQAVRAVGGANNHNRISIIVPCHRVIGANGSLTGYAGGLLRKKYLLELEKANI